MKLRLCLAVGVTSLASACGGGSGAPPNQIVSSSCAAQDNAIVSGLHGSGDGTGGGDGASDGSGAMGQFRNTLVIVRNRNLEVIGQARTDDERGMITIRLGGCKDPVEIEFRGGDGATYFDEATGQSEAFPEGYRLRARYAVLPEHAGVTPYTEAAVRLMESAPGGPPNVLEPDAINSANRRISEVLTDLVPGAFRTKSDGVNYDLIDITQQPVVLNASNIGTPNTLTNTPAGQYGAIIAGFSIAAGTFVGEGSGGDGAGSLSLPASVVSPKAVSTVGLGPSLRAMVQLVEDLADGQLDLQGPAGPVFTGTETPAYTYETFWRAKTIAAALLAKDTGDAALIKTSADAVLAEIDTSLVSNYVTQTCREIGCSSGYEARSIGGQTIRLYGDGRLTLRRSMSATFGKDRTYYSYLREPVDVLVPDPAGSGNLRFVEVKVGTRGEVIALRQDRRGFVYIPPLELYIVRGDEDPDRRSENEVLLQSEVERLNPVRISLGRASGARVVNFAASPQNPEDSGNAIADFLYVLADGSLRGARAGQPDQPVVLPQPAPLLSVVYDKFVPPSLDPRYGPAPAGSLNLPWTGPRRLFGLTQSGTVVVWLEGAQASGVNLAIPGKVVLLAGESKTGVYALTGDGKVFWINADQSHVLDTGATIVQQSSLADYPRRYALNHVEQVTGLPEPVCWLARTDAIACGSGAVYRWSERVGRIEFGNANASRTLIPVGIRAEPAKVDGIPPMWRLSGADEFFFQSDYRQSAFIEGIRYLPIDGVPTSPENLRGERNIMNTTTYFQAQDNQRAGNYQYITGRQLRNALATVFNAQNPTLGSGMTRSSTKPQGSLLRYAVVPNPEPGTYEVTLVVDNDQDPLHPPTGLTVAFSATESAVNRLEVVRVRVGDPDTANGRGPNAPRTTQPRNGALSFPDKRTNGEDVAIKLNNTIKAWDLNYVNPVSSQGESFDLLRIKLMAISALSPYEFRLCFNYEGQSVMATSIRLSRLGCSLHDNFGAFLGRIDGVSNYSTWRDGIRFPPDNAQRIDFGFHFEHF